MYRFVELNDTGKPFQISIKQMSGHLIELGTDPGDTIGDVIQFLSWHLGEYRTNRIVLMDENGPLKPATVITRDMDLSVYVETDADVYGELYVLTFNIDEAILHLEEEYRHLIEIGKNDDILEDFVDGWMDNILHDVYRLPSDQITRLREIAIRLIDTSSLSKEKKDSLVGRLMQQPVEEEEEFDPEDDPNYDPFLRI